MGEVIAVVFNYLDGGSLMDRLRNSPLVWRDGTTLDYKAVKILLSYCKGIAAGMQHLHDHNVVHRDLAARNVLLGTQGQVVVADFGFAYRTDPGTTGKAGENETATIISAPW